MVTVVLIWVRMNPKRYFMSGPTLGKSNKLKTQKEKLKNFIKNFKKNGIGIHWNEAKMVLVTAML